MSKKYTKLVRIKWHDCVQYSGWHSLDEVKKVEKWIIESVGWLVDERKKEIVIAMSHCENKAADLLVIPKKMILERWEL